MSLEDVMACIAGKDRLRSVKQSFQEQGNSLKLEEFVRIMLPLLQGKPIGT